MIKLPQQTKPCKPFKPPYMKLRQTGFLIVALILTTNIFAQSDIEKLVNEGIEYHDKGDYTKALEIYKKALKLDPESALIKYEMALSYIENGDYDKAVEYSDEVLKKSKKYAIPAYITKCSALERQGKLKESTEALEEAIAKTEGYYLLNYNLSINYFKLNNLDKAEENVLKAIDLKPTHSSSHYMLAQIHYQKENTVQSLLATYYFLLFEPRSPRSEQANAILKQSFSGNVTKDENNPNEINISLSPNSSSEFAEAELMLSMLEASKTLEENKGKTEDEMFIENTGKFFTILGELNKDEESDIWWNFYIPLFSELAKTEHLETYCKYITQSSNKNSEKWIAENKTKLKAFGDWLVNLDK